MGDSPKSEIPTRFSTPVNELDDHRFQPESLPRAEVTTTGRRPTRRSTANERPAFLSTRFALDQGSSRDIENAIEDDERSENAGDLSPAAYRRGSAASPVVARRDTFRRPRNTNEKSNRSTTSLAGSDRSVSPPNSVEAFAEPRQQQNARGRSGTALSQAPSFLALQPTRSADTSERRRTFSEDRTNRRDEGETSSEGSVEDDVCFPQQDEANQPYTIDFDDLHEFVAKHEVDTARVPTPFTTKHSMVSEDQRTQIFYDMYRKKRNQSNPHIVASPPTPDRKASEAAIDGESSVEDEKGFQTDEARKRQFEPINRWAFFSSELEEMIHAPELGDLLMPGETFKHLFELGPEGGVWWLDILMPSEDEVEVICKAFGIHGLTREDIVQQETREKVELFKSYYFVCFRSFYQMDKTSELYMEPVNVYAVVFREGIITFTFCPSPHAGNVRKRMGKLRDYVSLGADWICYALIDDIVDTFGPVIRQVEEETEAIEDNVFTARPEDSRAILKRIGDCRKTVMSLIRLVGGKADVIKGFAKRCNEQYSIAPRQDVGLYLSDIQDHVVTMMSNLGHFEKMLSRSHANYLAQISVDNIVQGNRANEVLSKVTFIATILVPLNLVCGLFGMNVPVPGKDSGGLSWFFGILGFLVVFVATATAVAKKFRFI